MSGIFDENENTAGITPSLPQRPMAIVPPPVTAPTGSTPVESTQPVVAAPTPSRVDTSARPRPKRSGYRYPDAQVAPELAQHLRKIAAQEKSSNPETARPHGIIVLQAIEKHQDAIRAALSPSRVSGGGLFTRIDPTSPADARRRRHVSVKPERITLSGVIKSDAKKLNELARDWANGNRSALVEAALRIEFAEQLDNN